VGVPPQALARVAKVPPPATPFGRVGLPRKRERYTEQAEPDDSKLYNPSGTA
jgi:hypothetical protein